MERQSKTIHLSGEVSRLEEEIETVKEEAQDLDTGAEEFAEKEAEFTSLSIQRDTYSERLESIEGDGTFIVEELSYGDLMRIRDDVMSVSDGDSPREGLYKVKILENAVTSTPQGISDDPSEWTTDVAEWVYDEVDRLNTGMDEENLDNYSLEEAMME